MATSMPATRTAPAPQPVNGSKAPAPAANNQNARAAHASRLGSVKRGQLRSALRYMFYGPEGVGKSTLLADYVSPTTAAAILAGKVDGETRIEEILLFDVEGGSDYIDVPRYMFRDEDGGHVPRSFDELVAGVEDLIAHPGHGFKAIGFDTIDAVESLIHKALCKEDGVDALEKVAEGFGKGYNLAVDRLREFLSRLDRLRAQGVEIVIVGHSSVENFKNPEGPDFDRYQLRAHKKFAAQVKEWCDVVGFVRFDEGGAKLKGDKFDKRARGWSTGRRIMHLARTAAWDAKSRLALPAELELDAAHPWRAFATAAVGASDADVQTLRAAILAELERIGTDAFTTPSGHLTTREKTLATVERGDASTLTRILTVLKSVNVTTETTTDTTSNTTTENH